MNLKHRTTAPMLGVILMIVFVYAPDVMAGEPQEEEISPSEQVHKMFRGTAEKIGEWMFEQMSEEDKKKAVKELAVDEAELRTKMVEKLLETYKSALAVTDGQARDILAGRFDDRKNRQTIAAVQKFFKIMNFTDVPLPFTYIFGNFDADEFKGIDLEFSARVMKAVLIDLKKRFDDAQKK